MSVYTFEISGSNMYVGGEFSELQSNLRNNAFSIAFDQADITPTLHEWNPNCNDKVKCLLLIDDVIYLGGDFTLVRGLARKNLAAVSSDTSLDDNAMLKNWNPNINLPTTGTTINCILYYNSALYIGGKFTRLIGTAAENSRNNVAAISVDPDVATPTLYDWNPDCKGGGSNLEVNCLTPTISGNAMFIGGNFTEVRDKSINLLTFVDADLSANVNSMVYDINIPFSTDWFADFQNDSINSVHISAPGLFE